MAGGFDYSGMESLAAQVEALQNRQQQFLTQFLIEMGLRVLAKTKKRTPVDEGELRRKWAISDVHRRGDELYIVLSNPMEYASFVEHGHMIIKGQRFKVRKGPAKGQWRTTKATRWWEGYHMAKISIAEIERELPIRYQRAMQSFLNGLG
jgi:Bacteriophage HK97-gp10, putative tail-component